ncbi:hypothetical protein [Marinobacter sp. SS21]|uniref:hypothetical protein n=1 Tax=Marinobacter sp. SS21 TaxID=2979460 RepID=UPI00232F8400|nr:hypothetical protein [Marinobacter sp. SS21]MDC0662119.1 hypothetical protein [Marinobacter sp. SS21]
MRNVIDKAMSVFGQRKSKSSRQGQSQAQSAGVAVKPADWDMSPEDALRVGTVAGYK